MAELVSANIPLSWQAIQSWSGNYPTVMGSGGSFILPGDLFKTPQSSSTQ